MSRLRADGHWGRSTAQDAAANPGPVLSRQRERELTASQEKQPEVEADGYAAAECRPYHQRAGTLGASPRHACSNHPGEHRGSDVANNVDMSLPVDGARQNRGVSDRARDAADSKSEDANDRHERQSNGDHNHCIGDRGAEW